MRAVAQRVSSASVSVEGPQGPEPRGAIGEGLLVYLGVALGDGPGDAEWAAEKVAGLRVFDDAAGRMNLSVSEAAALAGRRPAALVVSQFTLMGDARKGRRPSWSQAAPPGPARELYGLFIELLRSRGIDCESGEFQARMTVSSANSGPVTILLDSAGRGGAGDHENQA